MYIKPAPGMRIVDPAQMNTPDAFLPPAGREVQASEYWHRRLRDGDVVAADAPADPVPENSQ